MVYAGCRYVEMYVVLCVCGAGEQSAFFVMS